MGISVSLPSRQLCSKYQRLALGCLVLAATALVAPTMAQVSANQCGGLAVSDQLAKPFDYRVDRGSPLSLVEGAHFTPEVEALVRGRSGTLTQDIDYTLRLFPNHPRALLAAVRLTDRMKTSKPSGFNYPMECYFERALRWRPDDQTVRMIYAGWLAKQNRRPEGITQLETVDRSAADNPFTQYNLGLMYLELGDSDRAVKHAHQAMALGFPRTELKDRLVATGKWVEPKTAEPPASAQPPASSASGPSAQ